MSQSRGLDDRNRKLVLICNQAAEEDWYDDLREAVNDQLSKNGNRELVGTQVVTLQVVVESAPIEVQVQLNRHCLEVATGKRFHRV